MLNVYVYDMWLQYRVGYVCVWVFGGGCVSGVYEIRQLAECVHRSSSRTLVFGRPLQNDETNFIYTKNQLRVVVRGHIYTNPRKILPFS